MEMVYGCIQLRTPICHTSPDDRTPQMWLIVKGGLEMTLIVITTTCDCCCDTFFFVTSFILGFLYIIWIFIGANETFESCFILGFNLGGTIFVGLSIFAGLIISFVNICLVDRMYKRRVEKNRYSLPVYNALRK